MSRDKIGVAVKVGDSTDIVFDNEYINSYRAITLKELEYIISNNKLDVLIIERVEDSEYSRLKRLVEEFSSKGNTSVFFYVKDNDETTCGMADELVCDIFLDKSNLYKAIKNIYSIDIGLNYFDRDVNKDADDSLFDTIKDKDDKEKEDYINSNGEDELVDKPIDNDETVEEYIDDNKVIELDKYRDMVVELRAELDKIRQERDTYKDRLESIKNQRDSYKNNIDNLTKKLDNVISIEEYNRVKSQIISLNDINASLKDDINKLKEQNSNLVNIKTDNENVIKDLKYRYKIEIDNRNKLLLLIDNSINRIANLERVLEEKRLEITSKDNEINKLKSELVKLKSEYSNVDNLIENAKRPLEQELNKYKTENIQLNTKINIINAELNEIKSKYDTIISMCGMDETGIEAMLETNETLKDINNNLRKELSIKEDEVKTLRADNNSLRSLLEESREANKKLNASLKAMTFNTGANNLINIYYDGHGIVVPVFGSGSFGITTTAVSIALKLAEGSRVIFVDFDTVMPKADIWFKMNPIVKELKGTGIKSEALSGLGIFIEKGANYFIENSNIIIKRVLKTSKGYLDYLSGLYYRPSIGSMIGADYSNLFRYLGNSYNYIIVDFGRLGTSALNDNIIKAVSDISNKKVIVTNKNKLEVRTFNLKLMNANIDKENTLWLLNMCNNTSLDDKIKSFISPADYSIMMYSDNIRGNNIVFGKDRSTRGRFKDFMKKLFTAEY